MAIIAGQKGRATDFIYEADISDPSTTDDQGKVPKLESNGRLSNVFVDWAFGDGSDGDVVLDGSADFAGFSTRSGSEYTLTRDIYPDNLTINGGVILKPSGWRIYVKTKIDGSGKIQYNGSVGGDGSPGLDNTSQSGGGGGGSTASGYFTQQSGGSGGNGRQQAPGDSGQTPTGLSSALGSLGGNGGGGGAHTGDDGGLSGNQGGGSGGVPTKTATFVRFGIMKFLVLNGLDLDTSTQGYPVFNTGSTEYSGGTNSNFAAHVHTVDLNSALQAVGASGVLMRRINGSTGGGGGGAGGGSNASSHDQTGGAGGGGGSAGGIIFVVARIWAGSFEIEAIGGNGGNGGNGSTSFNDSGGGGGGGGGAGGVSIFIYQYKTWSGSYDLAGGQGGTGGLEGGQGGATAAGTDGSDGADGVSYEYFIGDLA